jgi:hypothetical protein
MDGGTNDWVYLYHIHIIKPILIDFRIIQNVARLAFNAFDRLVFASVYRIAPNVLNAIVIVKPP